MLPAKLNPLGVNPYDGVMEFEHYEGNLYRCYGESSQENVPSTNNPSPITNNYPKGRYKTNLPGITIKLDDDLRGIGNYKDYVEVDISTKQKSITRNCYAMNKKRLTPNIILLDSNSNETTNLYRLWYIRGTIYNGTGGYRKSLPLCNYYNTYYEDEIYNNSKTQTGVCMNSNGGSFFARDKRDPETFKKWFDSINLEICYALETPITTLL